MQRLDLLDRHPELLDDVRTA
ncbi:hypothetical protein V2K62_18055 [Pseudomonas alliivorans]|nr:hypothetical protein [Pseudomonas alliivorans]MEE4688567.1 hypothetical protein [Pseudomonas alliivorans]MEE4724954.1 hypothetical protein [Pseudomonas alliivorans]MEE4803791.1 hypothetical protein [Pseudomonas alliivorans]MEE4819683.1 hypothetical protein [Pseudomonas alliivorans]